MTDYMSHYDIIIIGSGAGGGTLAHKLAPSGKRILIIERGDYLRHHGGGRPGHGGFVLGHCPFRKGNRPANFKRKPLITGFINLTKHQIHYELKR